MKIPCFSDMLVKLQCFFHRQYVRKKCNFHHPVKSEDPKCTPQFSRSDLFSELPHKRRRRQYICFPLFLPQRHHHCQQIAASLQFFRFAGMNASTAPGTFFCINRNFSIFSFLYRFKQTTLNAFSFYLFLTILKLSRLKNRCIIFRMKKTIQMERIIFRRKRFPQIYFSCKISRYSSSKLFLSIKNPSFRRYIFFKSIDKMRDSYSVLRISQTKRLFFSTLNFTSHFPYRIP